MRILTLLLAAPLLAAAPAPEIKVDIKVDQVGYLTNSPKLALLAARGPASGFTVRDARNDAVVFRGKLSDPVDDRDSGDRVQAADFSAFHRSGAYYLEIPGVGSSWNFEIGPDV